ncbi:hypothetical protein ACFOON_03890 [Novosphingobium piscinae]|nr:hypothetical protein [Novosphingobium piscinae]
MAANRAPLAALLLAVLVAVLWSPPLTIQVHVVLGATTAPHSA